MQDKHAIPNFSSMETELPDTPDREQLAQTARTIGAFTSRWFTGIAEDLQYPKSTILSIHNSIHVSTRLPGDEKFSVVWRASNVPYPNEWLRTELPGNDDVPFKIKYAAPLSFCEYVKYVHTRTVEDVQAQATTALGRLMELLPEYMGYAIPAMEEESKRFHVLEGEIADCLPDVRQVADNLEKRPGLWKALWEGTVPVTSDDPAHIEAAKERGRAAQFQRDVYVLRDEQKKLRGDLSRAERLMLWALRALEDNRINTGNLVTELEVATANHPARIAESADLVEDPIEFKTVPVPGRTRAHVHQWQTTGRVNSGAIEAARWEYECFSKGCEAREWAGPDGPERTPAECEEMRRRTNG